uniref:Uncharacterized protein n=1 Tax=Anguilla anguilla TaxID=7936 RepID=A0A0E9SXE0_ANGAN
MDVRTPLASISLLCDYCSVTKNKNISIIISTAAHRTLLVSSIVIVSMAVNKSGCASRILIAF